MKTFENVLINSWGSAISSHTDVHEGDKLKKTQYVATVLEQYPYELGTPLTFNTKT